MQDIKKGCKKKIKILIVIYAQYRSYGGPYQVVTELSKNLNTEQFETKIIFKNNDVASFNVNFRELVKYYDIVHLFGLWQPWINFVAYSAKKQKKKIIWNTLGSLEEWSLNQKKFKKKLALILYQKKILEYANLIQCTSQQEEDDFKKLKINVESKIVPHSVSLFDGDNLLNRTKKFNQVLFFSRIHPKKGLEILINIWRSVIEKLKKNLILNIYGPISDESYYKYLVKKTRDLNLERNIIFNDPIYDINQKNKIFLNHDFFILTSFSENFGISIAEALSYGLPVLTTNQTPWEIIDKNNAGIICELNEKSILNSILEMCNKPLSDLNVMSQNAKKLIEKNFSHKSNIPIQEEIYKNII